MRHEIDNYWVLNSPSIFLLIVGIILVMILSYGVGRFRFHQTQQLEGIELGIGVVDLSLPEEMKVVRNLEQENFGSLQNKK